MSKPNDYDVTEAMIRYGGGFASGLGRLYRQADRDNQAKLRAAFPEMFEQYRQLVEGFVPSTPSQEPPR